MAEIKPLPFTKQYLSSILEYKDGKLYWKVKRRSRNPGDLAGCPFSNGYWRISIKDRAYRRSRLVWMLMTGKDNYPKQIDHINRDKDDDRIENLRLVTHGENQRNRAWGSSKYRHVYRETTGKWRARVSTTNRKRIHLGVFSTEMEAVQAVKTWEADNE